MGCIYGAYLNLLLSLYAYLSLVGWAAMNLSAGTLTTQHVARLDMYMRERMYATVYSARILKFS